VKLLIITLLLSGGVLAAGQTPPHDYVLDILGYPLTPEDHRAESGPRSVSGGVLGGASHGFRPQVNLRVTLNGIDRRSYETGDMIVYEVSVENVGRRPVTMPWSPDLVLFNNVNWEAVRWAGLSLMVSNRSAKQLAQLYPQILLGADAVAGSLLTMAPGGRALIRVPGYWRTSDRELAAVLREPNGVVQVSAHLYI
jgi:hypothetical protein